MRHGQRFCNRIEAGGRVSGVVRLALEVTDSESTAGRLVAAGAAAGRAAGDHALGRPQCARPSSGRNAADAVRRRARAVAASLLRQSMPSRAIAIEATRSAAISRLNPRNARGVRKNRAAVTPRESKAPR